MLSLQPIHPLISSWKDWIPAFAGMTRFLQRARSHGCSVMFFEFRIVDVTHPPTVLRRKRRRAFFPYNPKHIFKFRCTAFNVTTGTVPSSFILRACQSIVCN